jgi:inhibitor of KinA sporulation pathway (predicted exonuclease)
MVVNEKFVRLIIIITQNADQNPAIETSGTTNETTIKRAILIKTVKIPNERKIKGAQINLRIGFKNEFANPRSAPAINKCHQVPVKETPGKKYAAIKIATELDTI